MANKPPRYDEDIPPAAITTLTLSDRHKLNLTVGRMHALLGELISNFEAFGKCDPHDRWRIWFTENSKVLRAMKSKLFHILD